MAATETQKSFNTKMDDMFLAGHALTGVSIGVKLKLFEAITELSQPFTVQQLALESQCKDRYIKEWLHHMVVTDVVEVDESGAQFTLPQHRWHALTSQDALVPSLAGPFLYMFIPHEKVMECFRKDGPNGLPFKDVFPVFREYNLLPSWNLSIASAADYAVANVAGLKEKLEQGIFVCDLGCGNGVSTVHLASHFAKSTFIAFDLDDENIRSAEKRAKDQGIENVTFYIQDICEISKEWSSKFEFMIMHDVFHDLPHPKTCAEEMFRCLKDGASLAIIELFTHTNIYETNKDPGTKFNAQTLLPSSIYHCLISSMATEGSVGLGSCAGVEAMSDILKSAGFHIDVCEQMDDDIHCFIKCDKPKM